MENNELVLVGQKVDSTNIKWLVSELGNLPDGTEIFASVPKKITLELTPKEASVLYTIFNFIGGDPDNSARFHTNIIWQKLHELGVEDFTYRVMDFIDIENRPKSQGIHIVAPK